jgi:phosphoribosylformylglycinamidine synthase
MASTEFDDASDEKRPTVQVGDPFTEKLLLEACLELMESDSIIAIQDMGAAGLTSSSVEMASKGGVGIRLQLCEVPCRESNMTPYEMMLSESQERMLMVLKPGREETTRSIFKKWGLDFVVIGQTTNTQRLELYLSDDKVADIPIAALTNDAPEYDRPWIQWPHASVLKASNIVDIPDPIEALRTLIGSPDLASRRWIWEQYDSSVMADTMGPPGSDAAIIRVHGTRKALAITTDVTPRYCMTDPLEGGKQAVVEAWRNLTAVGAKPLAMTDCLNFGNPERPEIMGQFVGCIQGMTEASQYLAFPFVSGNVSFYNETNGEAILPTPAIGAVGLIEDLDDCSRLAFQEDGDVLILIGETGGHLGASLYAREFAGREDSSPPPVKLAAELKNGTFVRTCIEERLVSSVHDISDGGLLVAVAEMALAGHHGANVNVPDGTPKHAFLFGEDQARYVLAVNESASDEILRTAADYQVPAQIIGEVGGEMVSVNGTFAITLRALRTAHEDWLPNYMEST